MRKALLAGEEGADSWGIGVDGQILIRLSGKTQWLMISIPDFVVWHLPTTV
jgi:hypothetical protein